MADNKNKGIFDTLGSMLGADNVEQSTGDNIAKVAKQAFDGDTIGLGSILGGDGLTSQLKGLLDNVKSLNPQQVEAVLGALNQSNDPKVQSAQQDLAQSKNDGEVFVQKLKGYASILTQYLPKLLPLLQGMTGKK